MIYCFPDTNVFMHFQTFNEVDWNKVLNAPHVCLVITPNVFDELDKYKDDSKNERRRQRVRTILPLLEKLLDQVESGSPVDVRPGVVMIELTEEPMVDWPALRLDPNKGDDRQLASMVEFIGNHPDARVVLVTDDSGPRRKAKRLQIEVIDPEGKVERKELHSPEATRIKELEQKIQELEKRFPKVTLAFWENDRSAVHVIRALAHPSGKVLFQEAVTEQLREKQTRLEELVRRAPSSVSRERVDKFRREYERYLQRLRRELNKQRVLSFGEPINLTFVLQNSGTAPAEHVDIVLKFPAGCFVVGEDDKDSAIWGLGELDLPDEPVAEWLRPFDFRNLLGETLIPIPPRQVAQDPRPRGPLYDEEDRSYVYYEHPKLRHQETWYMKPICAYIPPESSSGFCIKYTIHVDNLPKPVEGELHVRRG